MKPEDLIDKDIKETMGDKSIAPLWQIIRELKKLNGSKVVKKKVKKK